MRMYRHTINAEMNHMRWERFGDGELVAPPKWVPPLVPPTQGGQRKLRLAMMNHGIPMSRSRWEQEWQAAVERWSAMPEEFRRDHEAWRAAVDYYDELGDMEALGILRECEPGGEHA